MCNIILNWYVNTESMEGNLQGKETPNYFCDETVYVSCHENMFSPMLCELIHGRETWNAYQLTLRREKNKNTKF